MSLTGNYEAAFELTEEVVKETFEAAWSAGAIPHELSANASISGIDVEAIIKVLQTNAAGNLAVSFTTPVNNGLKMTLPLDVEVKEKDVDTSAAPSINPVTFHAALEITAPVQALADTSGNKELALNLSGLPDGQVVVTMPATAVIPVTASLIEDGLHKAYDDNIIPHTHSFGGIQVDIVDDDANPGRQIKFNIDQAVSLGNPGHGTLSLPLLIHFGGGVEIIAGISNVTLTQTTNLLTISFGGISASNVTIVPTLPVPFNDQAKSGIASMISGMADYPVFWPSNDAIGHMIRDQAKTKLNTWGGDGNGRLHIFTPNSVENLPISIVDFDVSVQPGFLAVLFNPMTGANAGAAQNFIPSGKKFAQMLDVTAVLKLANDAIKTGILDENGCGGWPCKLDHKIKGHWVKLDQPSVTLHNGYMKIEGSSEVEVDCWFDPSPDYEAKVDFSFETDSAGNKTIKPRLFDEDVDLSCFDWFIGLIIPIYGWIALGVASSIVDAVGGKIVHIEGDKIASGTKYLAGEIHGVGSVESELDQIDVKSAGLILSGGVLNIDVGSLSQPLTSSDSGSPYTSFAAAPLTIASPFAHSSAQYAWKFGDGGAGAGKQVQHTYLEDGIYIVKLKTSMTLPLARTTHHFARVNVKNVQPIVDAGVDITVNEGEVISFVGYFTDPEWLDTHTALWGWGDDSCDPGTVAETNSSPQASGTVSATHAYCDDGVYTVTLWVIDDDGGVGKDTRQVTVLNVAPSVDAGDIVYAYECVPINMIANFVDPGWCDKHTAVWEFGDCSPDMVATLREVNQPPIGYGIAAATHTYKPCGRYLATCTVTDDDGGVGRDSVVVQFTGVKNADFEDGFRNLQVGRVANGWQPYQQVATAAESFAVPETAAANLFYSEQFVVHDGQRSQRIAGSGRFNAGIYQQIGANLRWDYQVSVWYHLDENHGGRCRLGIDPTGGTDANSADILWVQGSAMRDWALLTGRVTARARLITVFLDAEVQAGSINAYFDEVILDPYPCPLPKPKKPRLPEPKPQRECIDWHEETSSRDLGTDYSRDGFVFRSRSKQSMQLVVWGTPEGQGKLLLQRRGIIVTLPFAATRVVARVLCLDSGPIKMDAADANGQKVGPVLTQSDHNNSESLELAGNDLVQVRLVASGQESLLIELCVYRGDTLRRVDLVGADVTHDPGSVAVTGKQMMVDGRS